MDPSMLQQLMGMVTTIMQQQSTMQQQLNAFMQQHGQSASPATPSTAATTAATPPSTPPFASQPHPVYEEDESSAGPMSPGGPAHYPAQTPSPRSARQSSQEERDSSAKAMCEMQSWQPDPAPSPEIAPVHPPSPPMCTPSPVVQPTAEADAAPAAAASSSYESVEPFEDLNEKKEENCAAAQFTPATRRSSRLTGRAKRPVTPDELEEQESDDREENSAAAQSDQGVDSEPRSKKAKRKRKSTEEPEVDTTATVHAFLDAACTVKPTPAATPPTPTPPPAAAAAAPQLTQEEEALEEWKKEWRAQRVAVAIAREANAMLLPPRPPRPPEPPKPPKPPKPPSPPKPPKPPKPSKRKGCYNPIPKLALAEEYDLEHTSAQGVTTPMPGESRTVTYRWNGKETTVTVPVQFLRYEPVEKLERCMDEDCDHSSCGDYIALRVKNWKQETNVASRTTKTHDEKWHRKRWYAEDDEIRARGARCQSCGKEWQPRNREQFQWTHRGGKERRNNNDARLVANMPFSNPFWNDVWLQCKKCHDSLPDWGGFRPNDHKFVLPSPKKGVAVTNAQAEGQGQ